MLILPRSCFLHVPKTGGIWVREAINVSGVAFEECAIDHIHIGLKDCPCPEKYKFAFVRHPLDRYRSYWQYKMGAGWGIHNSFDRDCCSADFHDFIRKVLEKHPGICGRDYTQYVGPPENEIEFIGKYENLVEDLIQALRNAGEQFDEQAIRSLPPKNVSNRARFAATYAKDLEEALKEAEQETILRFNYA
jgi:hypothetical protein